MVKLPLPNQSYGISYVDECQYVVFAECFARNYGVKLITEQDLQPRNLWVIESNRPLRLFPMYGNALIRIGADAQITSTTDYEVPRQWAEAIHNHPAQVDGILYRSRLDNDRFCCGIFNRVVPDLTKFYNKGSLLDNPGLLAQVLDHDDIGLAAQK